MADAVRAAAPAARPPERRDGKLGAGVYRSRRGSATWTVVTMGDGRFAPVVRHPLVDTGAGEVRANRL